MNLRTNYLGLKLRTPIVPSASPLSEDLDNVKRMEDAGAAAVVFQSLFEEQIRHERHEPLHHPAKGPRSKPQVLTCFPESSEFHIGPERYLKNIQKAKSSLGIPIIASLNGSTMGNWIKYAKQIEDAGADALELNIYWIPTDLETSGTQVEQLYLEMVRAVKKEVDIPLAVKLSPYFTSFANIALQLVKAGADGLVLFNRFCQPDIDIDTIEIQPNILLSTPMDIRLPLRWVAILRGRLPSSLAATGGIHCATDLVKLLMAGADVTMICSALMRHGIPYISTLEWDLKNWMEQHEYESVGQMKGSLSQLHCIDPSAFERAQYMRAIATNVA